MKLKTIIYGLLAVCILPGIIQAQSTSQNYRLARTYQSNDATQYLDVIEYVDGLGRPEQTVQRGITPTGKDLVTLQEYDEYGRESLSWLPAVSTDNGAYGHIATIKNNVMNLYGRDQNPYSQTIYEQSPLNRITEQYGTGQDWYTNYRSVTTEYQVNQSGNRHINCIRYRIAESSPNDTILSLIKEDNYDTGELYVTIVRDEDQNKSYEFKNKSGQVILTRQEEGDIFLDTYYIYDDLGNLRIVLPPEASEKTENGEMIDTVLSNYAYLYKYDHRNRCIAKKLPGSDWQLYIYDKSDRLIFSQDGEQRVKGEWFFSIADPHGRTVLSGTCKNTDITHTTYNGLPVTAGYTGNTINHGYTVSNFTPVSPVITEVNYYDNYDFLSSIPEASNYAYDSSKETAGYGKRYNKGLGYESKGLLTGTINTTLGSDILLYSVIYYDYRKQPVQTHTSNHKGGIESACMAYNFSGQPVKKLHNHKINSTSTALTELYVYNYDHAGRLLEISHQINQQPAVILSQMQYDEQGRLKTKSIGIN